VDPEAICIDVRVAMAEAFCCGVNLASAGLVCGFSPSREIVLADWDRLVLREGPFCAA
jgi:hypothetical protein